MEPRHYFATKSAPRVTLSETDWFVVSRAMKTIHFELCCLSSCNLIGSQIAAALMHKPETDHQRGVHHVTE
jgi:hypothetical protein